MLLNATVSPMIAVSDLEEATGFYGGTLGLRVIDENEQVVRYQSGDGEMTIYVSEYAGSNKATYASWEVDDLEEEVEDLKSKDVQFERYDLPDVEHDGDIHTFGDHEQAAWFLDPDGNILCLHQKLA